MAYILKNTSGLVNTRLTDTGRLKLSQGNFNISYFQIGDSEVSYNTLANTYNQTRTNILEPNFNSQNSAQGQTNKQNIKYPYYVDGTNGNTYGIPFMSSEVAPIYNTAAIRGFFSGNTTLNTWSAITSNSYVINSNYVVDMNSLSGGTTIKIIYSGCNTNIVRLPAKGDFITIYYDGNGATDCGLAATPTTPTPTPTPTVTPSYDACALPLPTPTPSATCCVVTPTGCTPTPTQQYVMSMSSCYSILTYRIVDICLDVITLDRVTPDFSHISSGCSYSRILVYPPNMTTIYDSVTPLQHWNTDVINYESVCNTDQFDVKVWNMNIPWSENPAGLFDDQNIGFKNFTSSTYLGTKEYLGYMTSSGQTFVNSTKNVIDPTYYNDSFGNKIIVKPEDQKAIAIIHYTNQTIDFFYGEKFAMEPYSTLTPDDTTGDARNFKLHIPWLMWHKSPNCCTGETFYVDPPNDEFVDSKLLTPYYIQSTKNTDMNNPGIRYYNLWDTYPSKNDNSIPNRVGKVFPDQKIIVIDDDELVAALSYKSNRNWTLPAATTSLITPNTCNTQSSNIGVLTNPDESMYISYLLTNSSSGATNSLHCNYYSNIVGPFNDCNNIGAQNVAVRFNGEFNCLNQITNTPIPTGYLADTFQILCQKVTGNTRPVSSEWRLIDFSTELTSTNVNGYITQSGLTGNTFVITNDLYNSASGNTYNLNDYIDLPTGTTSNTTLNFGDEYYFYGSLETDIQATIYEMKYKINLGQAEFQTSSNPSWSANTNSYITEIGLYDDEMNLMIVSKLQSPVLRQGIQQFLVKFDF
jgi:hypothetical protein